MKEETLLTGTHPNIMYLWQLAALDMLQLRNAAAHLQDAVFKHNSSIQTSQRGCARSADHSNAANAHMSSSNLVPVTRL